MGKVVPSHDIIRRIFPLFHMILILYTLHEAQAVMSQTTYYCIFLLQ